MSTFNKSFILSAHLSHFCRGKSSRKTHPDIHSAIRCTKSSNILKVRRTVYSKHKDLIIRIRQSKQSKISSEHANNIYLFTVVGIRERYFEQYETESLILMAWKAIELVDQKANKNYVIRVCIWIKTVLDIHLFAKQFEFDISPKLFICIPTAQNYITTPILTNKQWNVHRSQPGSGRRIAFIKSLLFIINHQEKLFIPNSKSSGLESYLAVCLCY